MAEEILYNSPALHALKRHQLVSLSKRYGLKASGKNVELIDRLKIYASCLSPSRQPTIPSPKPTPARGLSDFAIDPPSSPFPSSPGSPLARVPELRPRPSDVWEVLSESGASLISPQKQGMTKSSSVSSWKSADNGKSLSEFGVDGSQAGSSRSKSSSMRALATSLSRRASRHLMSRSESASSNLNKMDIEQAEPAEQVEQVEDLPPSPASTVLIPRRHSNLSFLERPSTIRLCSPTPTLPAPQTQDVDELPFFNIETTQRLKERRSMAPLRPSEGPFSHAPLTRKSMPAIASRMTMSSGVPSIYPPLPQAHHIPPVPTIPGAYKDTTSPLKAFTFSISNTQFEDAGKKVLAEMDARMKAAMGDRATSFGSELLRGKKAEMTKLVKVREGLGEGGWGMAESSTGASDRYAEAHRREFARMRSIEERKTSSTSVLKPKLPTSASSATLSRSAFETPGKRKLSDGVSHPSAPNGLPLIAPEEGRDTKRKRLSPGPNALGSLREAGRSIVNLLGDSPKKAPLSGRRKRRPSVTPVKGRGIASRFGLFRSKRKESLSRVKEPIAFGSVQNPRSAAPSLTASSLGTTIRSAELPELVATGRRRSTDLASAIRPTSFVPDPFTPGEGMVPKNRSQSSSAQTVLSTTSSKIRPRARIPEFGPPPSISRFGSTNTLGPSKSLSGSTSSSAMIRKGSQADLIRNARPAPPPPEMTKSTSSLKTLNRPPPVPSLVKRSSTLYMPTASSLARMQATVKPSSERPLPVPPQQSRQLGSSANQPLNETSSSTRNMPDMPSRTPQNTLVSNLKPSLKPAMKGSPMKSPSKTTSSAAARHRVRASGLSAVKSRGNLKEDAEVAKRRAEIRARQERIGEERSLRELLGGND